MCGTFPVCQPCQNTHNANCICVFAKLFTFTAIQRNKFSISENVRQYKWPDISHGCVGHFPALVSHHVVQLQFLVMLYQFAFEVYWKVNKFILQYGLYHLVSENLHHMNGQAFQIALYKIFCNCVNHVHTNPVWICIFMFVALSGQANILYLFISCGQLQGK